MNTTFSKRNFRYGAGILAFMFSVFSAAPVYAATSASLSPQTISPVIGTQFTVVITVDPKSSTDYAEKIQIDYPADALSIASFSYDEAWMPFSLPGYESTDDTQGTLTRTADFPGGFSSPHTFGTVVFLAKKETSGTIKVGGSSIAFKTNGDASIAGVGTIFHITAAPIVPSSTTNEINPAAQTSAAAISAGFLTNNKAWVVAISIAVLLIALFFTLPFRVILNIIGSKKKKTPGGAERDT